MKLAQTSSSDNQDQILFQHKNEETKQITAVFTNKESIWLTVDNIVQTAINRHTPFRPITPHSFVMMLPLIHHKEPKSILELGAGALAIQRYLSISHPKIEVTSVENSDTVITATQKYFPHFAKQNVIKADAHKYVGELTKTKQKYDWILVDLFNGKELSFLQQTENLLSHLTQIMNNDGWLIINVMVEIPKELKQINKQLTAQFKTNIYLFAVPNTKNYVFLCNKCDFSFPSEIETHNLHDEFL